MDKQDIPFLSVAELGELIRQREVSPVEATAAYLDRIDALNFKFNSYLTVCRKEAMAAAEEAERAIAAGNYLGPMHGIPVAVKDQIWTQGIRTTVGSRLMADFFPDEDATAIAKLKEAGAVLLGKTNLTEFALGASQRYGYNRNPWDLDRFTGGSSGGSGSATSAFLCATSLGEDTGGSIRRPAAWCGIVGLRPSWGRVSRYGVAPGSWSMDQVGPISRTVEDAAITLGAIAGHDPKDPYTWDAPVPDYRAALGGSLEGSARRRHQRPDRQRHHRPRGARGHHRRWRGAGGAGRDGGGRVAAPHRPRRHAVHRPDQRGSVHDLPRLAAGAAPRVRPRQPGRPAHRQHHASQRLLQGAEAAGAHPPRSAGRAGKLRRADPAHLQELRPARGPADPVITSKEVARDQPPVMTRPFNLAGAPAISINCGFNSEGLPIGLQIGGRPFDESTILKVAHAYEQHTPWHTMRPPNA